MVAKNWSFYLLALACLLVRAPGNAMTHCLWAEDGPVFLMQSHDSAMSLVWPYHGYLHLYPRLIALLTTAVPLQYIPDIYALGWLAAFLLAMAVAVESARQLELDRISVCLLLAAIVLQPGTNELFFTLTNAQWWLGLALFLYCCVPRCQPPGPMVVFALMVACATGPFAVLLLPVLATRALLLRDWREHAVLYRVVVVVAAVQAFLLLTSPRDVGVGFGPADLRWADWLEVIWRFVSFGHIFPSLLLWVVVAWVVAGRIRAAKRSFATVNTPQGRSLPLLLLAMLVLMVSSGLTAAHSPLSLAPQGYLGRYFFLPYALLFFIVTIYCEGMARRLAGALLLVICAIGLVRAGQETSREDLQWAAYSRLAQQQPGMMMPVNPLVGHLQGWHVLGDYVVGPPAVVKPGMPLDLAQWQVSAASSSWVSGSLLLTPRDAHVAPALSMDIGQRCGEDRYLGLEISVERSSGGLSALDWSANEQFVPAGRLRGFYPAGSLSMQFALAREPGETRLRFYPNIDAAAAGRSRIYGITLFCLGS